MSSQNPPQPPPDGQVPPSKISIDFRHLLLRDFIAKISDDDSTRLTRKVEG